MIATDMTAEKLADEAIGLFLEYRDVHGYPEDRARLAAASEVQQGVDAEIELRAAGELPPLPAPPLPAPHEGLRAEQDRLYQDQGDTAEQARAEAAQDA